MNPKANMTKQLTTLKRVEVWLPILLTVLGNVIFLTAWAMSLKSDIRDLATRLTIYQARVDNLLIAVNSLESRVAALDAIHNIK